MDKFYTTVTVIALLGSVVIFSLYLFEGYGSPKVMEKVQKSDDGIRDGGFEDDGLEENLREAIELIGKEKGAKGKRYLNLNKKGKAGRIDDKDTKFLKKRKILSDEEVKLLKELEKKYGK